MSVVLTTWLLWLDAIIAKARTVINSDKPQRLHIAIFLVCPFVENVHE